MFWSNCTKRTNRPGRAGRGRRFRFVAVSLAGVLALPGLMVFDTPAGAGPVKTAARQGTVGWSTGFSNGNKMLWLSDAELASDLDGMARVGAKWVRVDFDWHAVQADGPNAWNWRAIDRVVRGARARGMRVLALPAYTPTWARPAGTTEKHPPRDPADFARFVRAAVERYEPRGVHHWEIWNEPNISMFWAPRPDATRYARLLRAAARAIHRADPDAVVISGGLSPARNRGDGSTIAPARFLERLYRAGVGDSFDAVGLHPYSYPAAPMTPESWNTFYQSQSLHRRMARHGDGAKRIWATEAGFGTGTHDAAVSEATQATRARQLLQAWHRFDYAGPIFWFTWRDLGSDRSKVWQNMGVLRHDFRAKPSRSVFASALREQLPR